MNSEPHTIPVDDTLTICDDCEDGGYPLSLGIQGQTEHFRCRNCGDQWSVGISWIDISGVKHWNISRPLTTRK